MQAASKRQAIPLGTKGPDDDFYCLKYQVWYRVADCVYRGRNRTYPGCVDCLQGYVNIRHALKGIAPPVILEESGTPAGDRADAAPVVPMRQMRPGAESTR